MVNWESILVEHALARTLCQSLEENEGNSNYIRTDLLSDLEQNPQHNSSEV